MSRDIPDDLNPDNFIDPDDLSELPGNRHIRRGTHGGKRPPRKRKPITKERRQRPAKVGRPTDMTPIVVDEFLHRMANGMSLKQICEMEDMPTTTTIMRWAAKDDKFAALYAQARVALADFLADETLEIADDSRNDYMLKFNRDGSEYEAFNPEAVARARLRVDQRKWYASVLAPRKYGPKVDVNHGGQADNPILTLIQQINGQGVKPVGARTETEQEHYRQLDYEDDDDVQDADLIEENGEPTE